MKQKKTCLVFALMLMLVLLVSCKSILPQPQSAYDIAVENGFQGSEEDWLASIRGDEGKSAYELYRDLFGYEGTEEQWLIDLRTGALISFKVIFDPDGGQAPEGFVSSITVRGGSFLDLKTPAKEGYTFLGWWTGDGDTDFAMTATTAVRSDLSLRAKWRSNVLSVRFLDKDGKLLKQETVPYGGAATAPEAPEVANFLFQKWDVDFSVVSEDLTVKAVYSPLYKLSFNTDGGTMIADATYSADEVPTAPIEPKKGNLVFRGWYADKDFTIPYDFSTPLTQNTTIYAHFSDMKPISTAEELKAIGDNSTGKFYLTNDINLGGEVWTPLNNFAGEFDGQGYKIYDFVISETKSAGFFTTNNGTIKNLTLSDFVFSVSVRESQQTFTAGPLVGSNSGTIENCHIKDAVLNYDFYKNSRSGTYNSYAGGLVGSNSGKIYNSTIVAEINGIVEGYGNNNVYEGTTVSVEFHIGGITGSNYGEIENVNSDVILQASSIGTGISYYQNSYYYAYIWLYPILQIGGATSDNSGKIEKCESNMMLTCTATKNQPRDGGVRPEIYFGGFVVKNRGEISESYATGSIETGTNFYQNFIGGFAADNNNQIKNCHTDVEINISTNNSKDDAIGGFVFRNKGTIASCYTTSTITSAANCPIGGFVGRNQSGGIISKSFASCDITYTGSPSAVSLFAGVTDDGGTISKNYYSAESKIIQGETDVTTEDPNATAADLATLQSRALLVDTLGWNTEVWEIVDGQYPTLLASK